MTHSSIAGASHQKQSPQYDSDNCYIEMQQRPPPPPSSNVFSPRDVTRLSHSEVVIDVNKLQEQYHSGTDINTHTVRVDEPLNLSAKEFQEMITKRCLHADTKDEHKRYAIEKSLLDFFKRFPSLQEDNCCIENNKLKIDQATHALSSADVNMLREILEGEKSKQRLGTVTYADLLTQKQLLKSASKSATNADKCQLEAIEAVLFKFRMHCSEYHIHYNDVLCQHKPIASILDTNKITLTPKHLQDLKKVLDDIEFRLYTFDEGFLSKVKDAQSALKEKSNRDENDNVQLVAVSLYLATENDKHSCIPFKDSTLGTAAGPAVIDTLNNKQRANLKSAIESLDVVKEESSVVPSSVLKKIKTRTELLIKIYKEYRINESDEVKLTTINTKINEHKRFLRTLDVMLEEDKAGTIDMQRFFEKNKAFIFGKNNWLMGDLNLLHRISMHVNEREQLLGTTCDELVTMENHLNQQLLGTEVPEAAKNEINNQKLAVSQLIELLRQKNENARHVEETDLVNLEVACSLNTSDTLNNLEDTFEGLLKLRAVAKFLEEVNPLIIASKKSADNDLKCTLQKERERIKSKQKEDENEDDKKYLHVIEKVLACDTTTIGVDSLGEGDKKLLQDLMLSIGLDDKIVALNVGNVGACVEDMMRNLDGGSTELQNDYSFITKLDLKSVNNWSVKNKLRFLKIIEKAKQVKAMQAMLVDLEKERTRLRFLQNPSDDEKEYLKVVEMLCNPANTIYEDKLTKDQQQIAADIVSNIAFINQIEGLRVSDLESYAEKNPTISEEESAAVKALLQCQTDLEPDNAETITCRAASNVSVEHKETLLKVSQDIGGKYLQLDEEFFEALTAKVCKILENKKVSAEEQYEAQLVLAAIAKLKKSQKPNSKGENEYSLSVLNQHELKALMDSTYAGDFRDPRTSLIGRTLNRCMQIEAGLGYSTIGDAVKGRARDGLANFLSFIMILPQFYSLSGVLMKEELRWMGISADTINKIKPLEFANWFKIGIPSWEALVSGYSYAGLVGFLNAVHMIVQTLLLSIGVDRTQIRSQQLMQITNLFGSGSRAMSSFFPSAMILGHAGPKTIPLPFLVGWSIILAILTGGMITEKMINKNIGQSTKVGQYFVNNLPRSLAFGGWAGLVTNLLLNAPLSGNFFLINSVGFALLDFLRPLVSMGLAKLPCMPDLPGPKDGSTFFSQNKEGITNVVRHFDMTSDQQGLIKLTAKLRQIIDNESKKRTNVSPGAATLAFV